LLEGLREIKIYGRSGQGVIYSAKLLAAAALEEGAYGEAYIFGDACYSRPSLAFARLSKKPINLNYPPSFFLTVS